MLKDKPSLKGLSKIKSKKQKIIKIVLKKSTWNKEQKSVSDSWGSTSYTAHPHCILNPEHTLAPATSLIHAFFLQLTIQTST